MMASRSIARSMASRTLRARSHSGEFTSRLQEIHGRRSSELIWGGYAIHDLGVITDIPVVPKEVVDRYEYVAFRVRPVVYGVRSIVTALHATAYV